MSTTDRSLSGTYQLFMLVLCVGVLAVLGLTAIVEVDARTRAILTSMDTAVCVLFFVDFVFGSVSVEPEVWKTRYQPIEGGSSDEGSWLCRWVT